MLASNLQLLSNSGISAEDVPPEELTMLLQALRASQELQYEQKEKEDIAKAIELSLQEFKEEMAKVQARDQAELQDMEQKLREEEKRISRMQMVAVTPTQIQRLEEAKVQHDQLAQQREEKQFEVAAQNEIIRIATQNPYIVLPALREAQTGDTSDLVKLFPFARDLDQDSVLNIVQRLPPIIAIPTSLYMSRGSNRFGQQENRQVKRRRVGPPSSNVPFSLPSFELPRVGASSVRPSVPFPSARIQSAGNLPSARIPSAGNLPALEGPFPSSFPSSFSASSSVPASALARRNLSLVGSAVPFASSSSSSRRANVPSYSSERAIAGGYDSVDELVARLRRDLEEKMEDERRQEIVSRISDIEDQMNRAQEMWPLMEKTYDPMRNSQSLIDLLTAQNQ